MNHMDLVVPVLKIKMSIPAMAISDAWPEEPQRGQRGREHSEALEFLHTEVFSRVVRECNVTLHPCNAKFVPRHVADGTRFLKQRFLNIRKLERINDCNGFGITLSFEVYEPIRVKGKSDENVRDWFIQSYIQPLARHCEQWKNLQLNTYHDDWCKKVYGQLAEVFRMMAANTGLGIYLDVEKK